MVTREYKMWPDLGSSSTVATSSARNRTTSNRGTEYSQNILIRKATISFS